VAEYYHTDALGSTLALTNETGAVQTTYAYEPFGNTTMDGASTNPFQYTGRENDAAGLNYYRARYYSPALQRFISEDPLHSPLYGIFKCRSNYTPTVYWYTDLDRDISKLVMLNSYGVKIPPLGVNPQEINAYAYVKNDPLNRMDPVGLDDDYCLKLAGGFEMMCQVSCFVSCGATTAYYVPCVELCTLACTSISLHIWLECEG